MEKMLEIFTRPVVGPGDADEAQAQYDQLWVVHDGIRLLGDTLIEVFKVDRAGEEEFKSRMGRVIQLNDLMVKLVNDLYSEPFAELSHAGHRYYFKAATERCAEVREKFRLRVVA